MTTHFKAQDGTTPEQPELDFDLANNSNPNFGDGGDSHRRNEALDAEGHGGKALMRKKSLVKTLLRR